MRRFTQFCVASAAALTWLAPVSVSASIAEVATHQYLQSSNYQRELVLKVDGEKLGFILNPSSVTSDVLVTDQLGQQKPYNNQTFTGVISGEKNTWARLLITDRILSGVYSREGRQYEIKTGSAGRITVDPLTDSPPNFSQQGKRQTLALTQVRKPVTRVAEIAVIVDSQFNNHHNGLGVQRALSIINAVDGIYREEFGLAIKLKKLIQVSDEESDPFNSGSIPIEQMLRNLRDYRLNSQELAGVSLVHLFTGNINSDQPVGLAWIDTACRNDGYDVGISTPYRYDVLLAAHEIAHNLGAEHDSDTSCGFEDDKVMWPYISFNTSQSFSNCTRSKLEQTLQNSCHATTIDLQVSLNQTDANTIEVTVTNNDQIRSNPSATLMLELPENSAAAALDTNCVSPNNGLECAIGTLQAGAQETVSITLLSTPQADHAANISVENDDYADPQPRNNHGRMLVNNGQIVSLLPTDQIADTVALGGVGGISLSDFYLALLILFTAHAARSVRQRHEL